MAEGKEKSKVLSPKQAAAEEKWNQLSTFIALDAKKQDYFESGVEIFHKKKGSLVVIGSGIKSVGHFTLEAISHIKNADKVLYCVADPATEVYIRDLCPEALDLNVFYADDKKRYDTYVQMSEACLYFARRGLNVVCIFYGHPGVFVLPSHRAIQIALKQGIQAHMLPAVSAEDCLFADLGVDPSYPGLQTLEATDMLLRKRKLLTDSHVIIWQVGCVGDLGFRRQGYLNHNFHIMIKYLQAVYDKEYVITHYIGAQFPMCGPLIEHRPLSEFMEADVAKRVTGISTFYIPPKEAQKVDPLMAIALGLIQNEKEAKKFPNDVVRPIANYGPRETKAVGDLEQWVVPHPYAHTPPTKAARYVASLATDIKLLQKHMKEPEKSMKAFELSSREMAAIKSQHSGRIRLTLKASAVSIAEQVVIRLVTDPEFASKFSAEGRKVQIYPNGEVDMIAWLSLYGYDTTLDAVIDARTRLQESSLLMWSGTYHSNIKSITFQIQGVAPPSIGQVWATGIYVKKVTFSNYTLSWASSDGNPCSASLVFTSKGKGILSFTGKYWMSGDPEPTLDNISGQNAPLKFSLANWVGRYKRPTTLSAAAGLEVVVAVNDSSSSITSHAFSVLVSGTVISGFTYDSHEKQLSWTDWSNATNANLTFTTKKASDGTETFHFSGMYWNRGGPQPIASNFFGSIDTKYFQPYVGQYKSTLKTSDGTYATGLEFYVSTDSSGAAIQLTTGETSIKGLSFNNHVLTWTSDKNTTNGSLTFYMDGAKKQPGFVGFFWTKKSTQPPANNIFGSFDPTFLQPWSAYYSTQLLSSSGGYSDPGPSVQVVGTASPSGTVITYGTAPIRKAQFNNPVLSWTSGNGNSTNGELTFHLYNNASRRLAGYVWPKGGSKPGKPNLLGSTDPKYLQSWNGSYNTSTKQPSGGYKRGGPTLVVVGGATEEYTGILLGKVWLHNFNYLSGRLTWTDTYNSSNGNVAFYLSKDKFKSFAGRYWEKGQPEPSDTNWIGSVKPVEPPSPHPGDSIWIFRNITFALAMGLTVTAFIEALKASWKAWNTYIRNPSEMTLVAWQISINDAYKVNKEEIEAEYNVAEENPNFVPAEPSHDEPTVTTDTDVTESTETVEAEVHR